jgi:hypothetical protein
MNAVTADKASFRPQTLLSPHFSFFVKPGTTETKMAEQKSTASQRLTQIKDFLTMNKTATTIPWDPDCTKFPTRKELPQIPGAPPEAAWVWGDNDYVC